MQQSIVSGLPSQQKNKGLNWSWTALKRPNPANIKKPNLQEKSHKINEFNFSFTQIFLKQE